ncbi:sensor domain-containing diguanylate cyclase [Anaeromicropila herbilytica]|uniref:Uncharacterized protein n=1 Tax=Anaeromicropila herbilytica TaxID=2785025 RepID=A0A7R7IC37_9FIRM|nr:diguanylate cyclase [Anaeromicropila herbilytica]BCN30318.1 hypothetical protein bsdtb5_16130 [Anaeromicropila herbilytica]
MNPILRKKKLITGVLIMLIITMSFIIVISFFTIKNKFLNQSEQNMLSMLKDISAQENILVTNEINDTFNFLNEVSSFCVDANGINTSNILLILKKLNRSTDKYLLIVGKDGRGFGYQKIYSVSDRDYFKKIMQGKKTVTNILRTRHNGERSIVIAVPIYYGNKIVGGVIFSNDVKDVQSTLQNNTLSQFGNTLIIHNDGSIIVDNKNEETNSKFYDTKREKSFMDYQTFLSFRETVSRNKSGIYTYTKDHQNKYLCYNYNRKSNWIIVTVIKKHCLDNYIEKQNTSIITFIYMTFLCIFILFVIIFSLYILVIRLLQKSQNQLVLEKERLETISEQSSDIIFDYNVEQNFFYFSNNFEQEFGIAPLKTIADIREMIFPDHLDRFNHNIMQLIDDKNRIEFDLRVKNATNDYSWYILSASFVSDKEGSNHVLGKMHNINEHKEYFKRLTNLAEIDTLTNLYNKAALIKRINKILEMEGKYSKHAYFFLDLDNFKKVNDTYGHQEGDRLLKIIGARIKEHFKPSDIIGRFGGDEFIIFMKNVSNIEEVKQKANSLCNIIYNESLKSKYSFSASIGIAIYPNDALNQNMLMKLSDEALYQAKQLGKNRYFIYQG